MKLDLHLHTTASDGAWPPEEVVRAAVAGRLDVIAITDHDTTAAVAPARTAADGQPIQIIAGIEISTTFDGREIHVLGYFVDSGAAKLMAHERRARRHREERIRGMVDRLVQAGTHVDIRDVLRIAGPDRASVGRPHLARALVEAGHVSTPSEAFDRLIGDSHPAFIPTRLATPWEAASIIGDAGGVPVWAHPPPDLVEGILPRFVASGLQGLEVYRPRNPPDLVLRLERLARAHGLLLTGGSDWHGPEGGTSLGDFYVAAEEVAEFMEVGGM